MGFVYVTEVGSHVRLSGGKILVEKDGETVFEIPKFTIEGLLVLDSVQITSQAMVEFLKLGIPVTWVSRRNKFFGRLESTQHVNVHRHVKQVQLQDSAFCLKLGKKIVRAKIHNQQILLKRYNRRREIDAVEDAALKINLLARDTKAALTTEELMGFEGLAARNYFTALGKMVPQEFSFEKRSKRPPRDAFNAMLSFGYSLLLAEVYTAVQNENLHPYFGCLHAIKEHHPALASDLMEEWRPVLIDSLVMSLVMRNEMKPAAFDDKGKEGVFLNAAGRKIFIRGYEKKMQTLTERQYTYRHMLGMQAASYAQALMAEDTSLYEPFLMR